MNKKIIPVYICLYIVLLALTGCNAMAVLFHGEKPEAPPVRFTVVYIANGAGGAAPESESVTAGTVISLPGQGNLTHESNIFIGWNENQNGAGTTHPAGSPVTVQKNITYYAQWIDGSTPQYTVNFSANGAAGGFPPPPQTAYQGANIALPGQGTLALPGKNFIGWNTQANGSGTSYSAGALFAVTGNTTLFAQWTDIPPENSHTYTANNSAEDLIEALQAINTSSQAGTYIINITGEYVINRITLTTNAEKTIIFHGAGAPCVLYNGGTDPLFTVPNRITLVLENSITLNGNQKSYPAVKVLIGGTLNLKAGAKITGAKNHGVWVNGGTFNMTGGSITSNYSGNSDGGGGVFVDNNGIFNFSDGTISDNTSDWSGGGVSIGNATFNMTDGTISGNFSRGGGGVAVKNGIFNMFNGTISANTVNSYDQTESGGGVKVSNGLFAMSGGTITGNTVTLPSSITYGGGVYILGYNGGIFTKNGGGIIDDTNSAQNGKAVYVSNAYLDFERNTTAGPSVNMDSRIAGSTGGWEE